MLAVSERSLRNAFHVVHIPPYRRLDVDVISSAANADVGGGPVVNVTEIATKVGFFQLGRSSVEYRKMLRERPSETMRQALRDRGCGVAIRIARGAIDDGVV